MMNSVYKDDTILSAQWWTAQFEMRHKQKYKIIYIIIIYGKYYEIYIYICMYDLI